MSIENKHQLTKSNTTPISISESTSSIAIHEGKDEIYGLTEPAALSAEANYEHEGTSDFHSDNQRYHNDDSNHSKKIEMSALENVKSEDTGEMQIFNDSESNTLEEEKITEDMDVDISHGDRDISQE